MKNIKRAIILDMDETLEHGTFKSVVGGDENGSMMTLRPRLDKLIEKLKVAKSQGIDIILCTTARKPWIERFLMLKPEFKELLDKLYTRDNENHWNQRNCSQKPVETFGYDSILFIDDNRAEKYRLQKLYHDNQDNCHIDITYFSGFGFGDQINLYELGIWLELAKQDSNLSTKIQDLLGIVRNDPGCEMMSSVITTFIRKEFKPGLSIEDQKYSEDYMNFNNKKNRLLAEIQEIQFNKEDELGNFLELTEEQKDKMIEYMSTDKKIPFEDIERILLDRLVQTAIDIQERLDEARKLEQSYRAIPSRKNKKEQEL